MNRPAKFSQAEATPERITAAACIYQGVAVWCDPPRRHADVMAGIIRCCRPKPEEYPICPPADQGFMTSEKRFVGRSEAKRIALAAGQPMLRPDHAHHEDLFSEDLW